MDSTFGSNAIRTLQAAYGFQTETPLWDSRKLFDIITATYPGLSEIHCCDKKEIKHVVHSWALGETNLTSGSHSALNARANKTAAHTLTMHYDNGAVYTQDGIRLENRPLKNAMLLVDAPGTAVTEDVSSLVIGFKPEKVKDVAQHMFDDPNAELNLFPHIIEFHTPGIKQYANHLPLTLAGLAPYPRMAEDTVHRFLAQLVGRPNRLGKRTHRKSLKSNQLNLACAFMVAHLHEEVTLSDLERVSLLSSRTLQIEFLERFGQSPMSWLLNQRLDRAYQLLKKSSGIQTIAQAAHQCGFRHMGRFSAAFRRKFGIKPSEVFGKAPLLH